MVVHRAVVLNDALPRGTPGMGVTGIGGKDVVVRRLSVTVCDLVQLYLHFSLVSDKHTLTEIEYGFPEIWRAKHDKVRNKEIKE